MTLQYICQFKTTNLQKKSTVENKKIDSAQFSTNLVSSTGYAIKSNLRALLFECLLFV
jgi:hypothetical protein